jgi:hypothetical protein
MPTVTTPATRIRREIGDRRICRQYHRHCRRGDDHRLSGQGFHRFHDAYYGAKLGHPLRGTCAFFDHTTSTTTYTITQERWHRLLDLGFMCLMRRAMWPPEVVTSVQATATTWKEVR